MNIQVSSCELLSKIIIFVTRHNFFSDNAVTVTVVNCFQKLLSSWHDTTLFFLSWYHHQLWIAFKKYYLRDTTQQATIQNHMPYAVVNCFQKLLSSWHDTTHQNYKQYHLPLWIAFKNYYLRDTTQQPFIWQRKENCCELLSKIIIFVTRHNT